jgi:2',3'-cyclic-nucleotide 2'-phosphodiesterase (5'-nucleotidase family)
MKLFSLAAMTIFVMAAFKTVAQTTEVIIISTNDVHGRIENLGKMAAYVHTLKKTHPNVFVFNAGDLINGNPVVDEAADKGAPIIDIMNHIPYDVSCLGNHEFENGEAILQRRVTQSGSTFIDANVLVNSNSAFHQLKPYTILHIKDGTAIAVLGLTASSSNPCLIPNITVTDPVKTALTYGKLKDSCQVLVALTHIGYKADSLLATKMNAFDVIVGGHSHTKLPHGVMVNGVLVTQAGDKLRFIGKTVLTIKNNRVINKTFEMVDLAKLSATDQEVQSRINFYNSNKRFKQIAGNSKNGFANKEELGSLKADAIAENLNLDITFDHARNVSYSHFPKGKITVGDVYEIDSYDYNTIRFTLTPAEIRKLILNSMKKSTEPVLFVSGITYTLKENTNGEVIAVTLKDKAGALLNEHQQYSVGMNSFIACHFMNDHSPGETLTATAESALLNYFKQHSLVDYRDVKRIFIEH